MNFSEQTKQNLKDIVTGCRTVLIVDVKNYLYRYVWAYQDMSIPDAGQPDGRFHTGHLYGFTRLMTYLKDNFSDSVTILCLDGKDETRLALNAAYKADREHPYDVDTAREDLLAMISLMDGIYMVYDEHYEADDAIGTVAKTIRAVCEQNHISRSIYILSSDKDMYQLIRDGGCCPIRVIKKLKNADDEVIGEAEVREKMNGVGPEDLVKFRSIVGDSSDCLKGYFRFRKANAAIIAENFDYDPACGRLYLKEHVEPQESWNKFLPTVMDDMQLFRDNYAMMKLKIFNFELINLSDDTHRAPLEDALSLMEHYRLMQFMESLASKNYSRYTEEIREHLHKRSGMWQLKDDLYEKLINAVSSGTYGGLTADDIYRMLQGLTREWKEQSLPE